MPRLIDADELKKSGYRLVHIDNLKPKQSCKSWAEVPTAYDVEKVVEQIHEYFNGKIDACEEDIVPQEILEYNKAICEIVRKGGVK